MGEAILALPEASGAVVEVKHMVEVTVAMAEVTLAGMEDRAMVVIFSYDHCTFCALRSGF